MPSDLTSENIAEYYRLYFQDACFSGNYAEASDNYKQEIVWEDGVFKVSKQAIDDISFLFGKENIDLEEYLDMPKLDEYKGNLDISYDTDTNSCIIKNYDPYGGYHNKERFDYTLSNIQISGDTAIVSCNTYYTEDYDKFMRGLDGESISWGFEVKVGIYKLYYKVINENIILDKTEFTVQPNLLFCTQ